MVYCYQNVISGDSQSSFQFWQLIEEPDCVVIIFKGLYTLFLFCVLSATAFCINN